MSLPPDPHELTAHASGALGRAAGVLLGMTLAAGCSFVDAAAASKQRKFARAGVHSRTVDLGPDRLHYWEGGRGTETVVLLHGFGADALWQWHPQIRALARDYRVIAPDLLWFGRSSSTDDEHSIEHQARAVVALLEHESATKAHVVGVSYGGLVAHEVIGQVPERIDRVVLIASPARAFLADDKREVLAELGVTEVEDLLLPQTPYELRRLMSLAYYKPPRVPDFVARGVLERYYRSHRPHHLELLHAVEENTTGHRQRFVAPRQPTLIIWGEHDRVFPKQAAFRIHEELGDASSLCVFDAAAHAPHLERSDDVTPMIRGFLGGATIECDPQERR